MANTTLNMQLLLRRDNVFVSTYVLEAGEPGFEISTNTLKIGDGSSTWENLPIANKSAIDKLISDAVSAHATGYYTKGEIDKFVSDINEAIGKKLDAATYNEYVEAHKDDYTNGQVDTAISTAISDFNTNTVSPLAQEVSDLDAYVGEIPETATAKNIVAYVQEKTAGIATDAALGELTGRVTDTEGDIDAINDEETGILANAKAYVDAEDKFEIDMVTVNAHGGIAAGEDLNGLTTHEILKKILYPYVQPTVGNATASPNGGTYEKGVTKTITSVSITVTKKSEPITSVALYNGSTLIEEKTGDAVKNGGTITFSGLSVVVPTNGNQLTVKVTDAKGTVQEKKTTAMTFVYPYYMGSCAAGTAIDETLVESLTKKVESKGNKSNSFTVSDGHMVFAYPKAHGVLKSILDPNNFETIGNYTRSEVSVTGLDGTAQTYYVYVSGATTVSGFAVNFKY